MSESTRTDERIDAALDAATIEHLDFEPICQVRFAVFVVVNGQPVAVSIAPRCEQPAVALMRCRVFRVSVIVCAAHRSEVASDPSSFCHHCKSKGPGVALWIFEPLPGGAQ